MVAVVMVARDSVSDAVAVTAAVLAACSVATAAVAQCQSRESQLNEASLFSMIVVP